MGKRAVVGVGTAALAGVAAVKLRRMLGRPPAESGSFANGMEYTRWGDGPKDLIYIPGGPGSDPPHGAMGAMLGTTFRPFVEAGYRVWFVTRKRNMPQGHSVEDMAADYAALIDEQFGGRVDTVMGISYGGLIEIYLAANHPEVADHFVVALAAATITPWGRDVDHRWAAARARGDKAEAGRVMAEYFLPHASQSPLRRVLGYGLGAAFAGEQTPPGDLLVEADAEVAFDARDALSRIQVPILMLAADEDMFFTPEIVKETAAGIADCTLVRYAGKGHMGAASSGRLPHDVLEYIRR